MLERDRGVRTNMSSDFYPEPPERPHPELRRRRTGWNAQKKIKASATTVERFTAEEASGIALSRVGWVQIAGFFSKEASRQLRLLARETDGTVQSLLTEARNDLFTKHHRPPIPDAKREGPAMIQRFEGEAR
jgi:hypothetical protein